MPAGARRGERHGQPCHRFPAPSANDGDEQVVKGPEVVMQLEARLRLDAAGRHRAIAVAHHDALGRIEEPLLLLRGRGSWTSGLDHVGVLAHTARSRRMTAGAEGRGRTTAV